MAVCKEFFLGKKRDSYKAQLALGLGNQYFLLNFVTSNIEVSCESCDLRFCRRF